MKREDKDEQFSPEEAQQRLEAALRGARIVPPIQKKDIPRKRPYKPRKQKPQTGKANSAG